MLLTLNANHLCNFRQIMIDTCNNMLSVSKVHNMCRRVLVRMLKVTICELFWLCVVVSMIVLYWTWFKVNAKTYEPLQNPVIVWWTSSFPGSHGTRFCPNNIKCDIFTDINGGQQHVDAYLFYASTIDFDNLPLPRRATEVIWGLYHEESPRNVEEMMHEEILNLFNYSSTFSRYSDVPFPLQCLESLKDITSTKYYVPTSIKSSFKDISPILYLQTDCETATERDAYVKELMKFIDIDSYGTCLNNKEMPKQFQDDYLNKLSDSDFLHFIARYKFVLAIENGVCEDYVTEKFWRAIKVGNVPIYFGSPSIRDWLPNSNSAILLEDYPNPEVMSRYVKKLINNDSLYEVHLEHKTKSLITNKRLINELRDRKYQTDSLQVVEKFECLICKRLHDKQLGKLKEKIVNKDHYKCPQPISALTLTINPANDWVYSWRSAKTRAQELYKKITGK